MIDFQKILKEIWENKNTKKFNIDDINLEFCLTFDELAEAFRAYHKKLPDIGEELADVAIYLLSLSKMLDVDLEKEIVKKIKKNKQRTYKKVGGVNVKVKGK
ncbi:MAG: MazG-like family protein [Patescibacteria group bacterium]|jgi:NTP pyrophosphatase (non-canonical NTP hydrolase)